MTSNLEKIYLFPGYNPLHEAAALGQVDKLGCLVETGWDIESTDSIGQTALHYAVRHNRTQSVYKLLEMGANPNAKLLPSETLNSDYGLWTPLHLAIDERDIESAKALIACGADIEAEGQLGGDTPLLVAVETCHRYEIHCPEIARTLIEMGANVNTKCLGISVLQTARMSQKKNKSPDREIIQYLIRAGAK